MHAMPPVVDKIMSCIALGLGLPEDFFTEVGSLARACSPFHVACNDALHLVWQGRRASACKLCRPACCHSEAVAGKP